MTKCVECGKETYNNEELCDKCEKKLTKQAEELWFNAERAEVLARAA